MKRLLTVGCVGLALACVSVGGRVNATAAGTGEPATAALQETTSTVLDGSFSEAQARRGSRVYGQNCETCHGGDLRGSEMAPSVAGSDFIVFWLDLPVGTLYDRIKTSMPEDSPGRLTDEEYTDIVAFLLDANGYPAGEAELPMDKAALDQIMIVANP